MPPIPETFSSAPLRPRHGHSLLLALLLIGAAAAYAQPADLRAILDRLDRLEAENRALAEEVRRLKAQLEPAPPIEERMEIQERRTEELAQSKVESPQKFPLRLTGTVLFNAFMNSRGAAGGDNPVTAALGAGPASGGATFRQTIIGLSYNGPRIIWNGKISGNVFMDFFNGGGASQPLNTQFRIRTGAIRMDWETRTITFAQDKPLISPRNPNSFSQVGVTPLTGAGNPWLWQPQVRFEQRWQANKTTSIKGQAALFQTSEASGRSAASAAATLEPVRPALEWRGEISHSLDAQRRFEIGSGFHHSASHVAGTSVPSRIFSLDWFANPWSKLEFSGEYFKGKNMDNTGILRQGFLVLGNRNVIPIHANGGWLQLSFLPTDRLTFNTYGGQFDHRNSDLRGSGIAKNLSYSGNIMYRLAPNVVISIEGTQVRTTFLGRGTAINNHYDLAVGYLF